MFSALQNCSPHSAIQMQEFLVTNSTTVPPTHCISDL